MLASIKEINPAEDDTKKFILKIQVAVAPKREEFNYENIATVVDEIGKLGLSQ